MLMRLKSALLRSFRDRFQPHRPLPYLEAQVRRALALNRRRDARIDGLELRCLKTTLHVEWIARGVHPWDRHRAAASVQKLHTTQCLSDTEGAIRLIFDEIPEAEALEVRVFSADSQPPILAGIVHRKDLRRAVYNSPGMNLKSLGMRFRLNDWRLEPLPEVGEHIERTQAHS